MTFRRLAILLMWLGATPVCAAETLRVATWHVELTRKGPGVLLRDLTSGKDAQVHAASTQIQQLSPDILLLTGFDTDLDGHAAAEMARLLNYPYHYSTYANSGRPTGRDLDKDGRLGEPEDAQSYGEFTGQGGLALFSRFPITGATDFSTLLWRDLPNNQIPNGYYDTQDLAVLRLSSHAHWDVAVDWIGQGLHLLAFAAQSPVFDGDEDRNGRHNADEITFWQSYLDGDIPETSPPQSGFIILGDANLDPLDGDGRKQAIRDLLADERLSDPAPRATQDIKENTAGHGGDPAQDTSDWTEPDPGNLRVDYVLPSIDFTVVDAGLIWPPATGKTPLFRHAIVWADIAR